MNPFDVLRVPLDGVSLVEASAGTGKTYAISTLVVRLLLEREMNLAQILVVTFTEAATAELRDRVRRRLQEAVRVCDALLRGEITTECDPTLTQLVTQQSHVGLARNRLTAALFQFDSAAIFTIHGFCQRVLRENAFATRVPFEVDLLQDMRPLVEEVLTDYWLSTLKDAPLSLIAQLDNATFTPKTHDLDALSKLVAQTGHLKVVPGELGDLPPIGEASFEQIFEEAKRLFDPPSIDLLLKAVYPRTDHRLSRERALRSFFNKPFGTEELPKQIQYFDPREWKLKKGQVPPQHPFFEAVQRLRAAIPTLNAEVGQHALKLKQELVEYLYREVNQRKSRRGHLSFDDLLKHVHRALLGTLGPRLATTLRGKYHAALIDEFQDTDPIQYGIFSTLFDGSSGYSSNTTLFLIGDPKQAIYSFRGADVFAYLSAASSVAPERQFTMGTNHRSDAELVSSINALFLRHPRPFLYDALVYPNVTAKQQGASLMQPNDAALDIRFIRRPEGSQQPYQGREVERLLPDRVADHVVQLLKAQVTVEGKRLSPKAIAILTRTNREAFDCQLSLAARGVPSVVQGDRSVFEQPEARELQLILAAVAEPANASAIRTALATELMGVNAHVLDALDSDEDAWDSWVDRFRNYQERWREQGFVQMFRHLLLECGITQRLLKSDTGERRMTNVLHLSELLHTESQAEHLGPTGLLQYLAEQRQRTSNATDSEQVRLESDEDAVVLTTIHKSKGLEYPIVFCPFLAGGASFKQSKNWVDFHDEGTRQHTLDLGSEEFAHHSALKKRENLSEASRLLYVALTRAKHRCVVYWGAFGKFHESAMAELLYGPSEGEESTVQKLDDAALLAPFYELARVQPGIRVTEEPELIDRPIGAAPLQTFAEARLASTPLSARRVTERVARWSRTASFTELTRLAAHHHVPLPASDHDELTLLSTTELGVASVATNRTTLAGFPGGANTGNFFHAVLEELDFCTPVPETTVVAKLLAHGMSDQLLTQALAGLRDTLATPFNGAMSLSSIATPKRLNELEFTLPVTARLDSRRLASAFAAVPSDAVPPSYASAVASLPFSALEGHLKGFVDLVFEHEQKWFLVDYKTNDLGEKYSDYAVPALSQCMESSHYILQYHLYILALHRYLALRQPGYDYERHFGGVYYLFLRGLSPAIGASCGVFFEKPPLERLSMLSRIFSGETQ